MVTHSYHCFLRLNTTLTSNVHLKKMKNALNWDQIYITLRRMIKMKKNKHDLCNIEYRELLILIIGRNGGKTTSKIIDKILSEPYNKNQLAKTLKLDYNTISHHINILYYHNYIQKIKLKNIAYYLPSNKLIENLDDYYLIKEYLKNR